MMTVPIKKGDDCHRSGKIKISFNEDVDYIVH